MSILIKALKQAEREHMARAAAAAPAFAGTAVLEPEAAPAAPVAPPPSARSGEALSLAPVELQEPAAPAGDAQAPAPSRYERRSDPQPAALTAAIDPASTDPTLEEPYDIAPAAPGAARTLADVLQTTDPGLAPARSPAAPANAAPATAAPRAPADVRAASAGAPQAPAQPATPAAAPAEDVQAEQRKAARQLMAPAPARNRLRRIGLVLGVGVLVAGALAGAYWQGLFTGLEGLWQAAPPPAPARSLAERMQSLPAAADKSAKPHTRSVVPPTPAGGTVTPVVPRHDGATGLASLATGGSNPAAQFKAGAALAAESARASDAIHLRPPEATPERIRALLQDAYTAAGRGDSAAAGRIYQQVIDLDHNNGDAWIGLAALASNSGDSAAANRDYRRALEIDPGDSVALGGLLGMQSGVDPQEAESRLRLLIVHDGAQPALQAALGKMLARQGRWLEAQETFYQAWIADPSQPDVAFNLAVTLERIRQPSPALSFYRRALELAQNHSARFNPAVAQERVAALTPKQP